ncbi:MAG: S46 family peptidase [Bacteroidales bacterium]|nr:S46 family peptidase [Bacteroidales bacterium]
MKRIFSFAALTVALFSLSMPQASADEGMWLLPLLEKMNINTMQQMGCKLSADDIYSINHSSLKDAVVIFGGGCTGEVVSDEGLLLTNHHCGYGSIQALSSVEHDYLTDGYWAMDRSQELPAAGLSVTFLESFNDITAQVEKALKKGSQDYSEAVQPILEKAKKENPGCKVQIYSMYGGNQYYLVVYKVYEDIRFVGAPPSSIGKFGADTDNWMWPRHTCDFSMFRIYADANNNPAPYSPDNKPYRPKNALKISLAGVNEGDFSFIMGYPGSTNRFMTASELREKRDISNEIAIYCRGRRQELMMEDMLADPKVKIQYASKYSGSSNGWKKSIGMNETFAKLDVENRRAADEKAFEQWVAGNKKREAKYGQALSKINNAVESRSHGMYVSTYLSETVGRIELNSIAQIAAGAAKASNPKAVSKRVETFFKDYNEPTDRKIAVEMIEICRKALDKKDLPTFYNTIDEDFEGDVKAYVNDLFDRTAFSQKSKLDAIINDADKVATDPASALSQSIREAMLAAREGSYEVQEQFAEGKKEYIAGQLEMKKGEAIYPDANFSMRLTYGLVKPYSPKDGVIYNYYTTIEGVMEKEDPDNWEFVVPEYLKELYAKKDYGRYTNAAGEMPACFIMSGDITGGNSGSPVMNAKGELIGLAFDGNWEAMSGDIIFEPEYQRCICVDIRYVLFIIDKYGHAGYLLDEMEIR